MQNISNYKIKLQIENMVRINPAKNGCQLETFNVASCYSKYDGSGISSIRHAWGPLRDAETLVSH